jgi:hypothetical protein
MFPFFVVVVLRIVDLLAKGFWSNWIQVKGGREGTISKTTYEKSKSGRKHVDTWA